MLTNQTHGTDRLRNLLVIAFHYPPDNTSTGVLRTFKFTEYLLRHRWRSHVISVPEHLYVSRNPNGADAIPKEITVERTWACDMKFAVGIRGLYPGWLGVPDRYWPWLLSATRAGARAIRRSRIDAIYSTCPIPTAHLIALRLKNRFGLPWIADFRDPWVEESMPRFRHWLEAKMERAVVKSADRIICNTPAMRRAFLEAYPNIAKSKFITITNGYDESEMAAVVPIPATKFQLMHPGVIDAENRNPKGLLMGVRKALDNGWLDPSDLQIAFLGAGQYGSSSQFREDLRRSQLEGFAQIVTERIPYRQALAMMAGTNVVVLLSEPLVDASGRDAIHAWTTMQVPVKLYEYLRLGKPLLALVSAGAVAEVLERVGAGPPVRSSDTDRIAAVLRRYYQERRPPPVTLPPAGNGVAAYSRENLTALLARELDTLVGKCDPRIASSRSPTVP